MVAATSPCAGRFFRRARARYGLGLIILLAFAAGAPSQPATDKDRRRVAELENRLGPQERAGKFAEAEETARSLLDLHLRLHGADHWQTVDARHLVDTFRRMAALPQAAQDELAEAARIDNTVFSFHQKGQHREAVPMLERALAVRERHLGKESYVVAQTMSALSFFLDRSGQHSKAESLHREALASRRRLLGDHHPQTTVSLNNLALNLDEQGKHADAEPCYRQVLASRQRVLGDDDPLTATAYNNVGFNLANQGKYTAAEPLFRRALEIRRRIVGEDHPDTATNYDNLASNLDDQGKVAAGEALARLALSIRRRSLGEDHPETANSYNNLAATLDNQGKHAEAQLLFEQALRIWQRTLGDEHPRTAAACQNLATNLDFQGRNAAAEPLLRRALDIHIRKLGDDHPSTSIGCNNLAYNLTLQAKHAEADPFYRQALASRRRVLGEDHPLTATSYNNLALALYRQGRLADAEPLFRQAQASRQRLLGADHPATTSAYRNLAYNLWAQGKHAEAEELATAAARSFEVARLHMGATGLERAPFGVERSPLPLLAACRARNDKPTEAWQALEADLARGLLDEVTLRVLAPEEAFRRHDLRRRCSQLDAQLVALLNRGDRAEEERARIEEIRRQRERAQADYSQLQLGLETRHGVIAGQVYDLSRIQGALPADTALLAWLDIRSQTEDADSNGDHWACLLRSRGKPIWVRLPGTGRGDSWTTEDLQLPVRVRKALTEPDVASKGDVTELAHRLARQRLEPLSRHLQANGDLPAVKHLIVLPVGWMNGVPIDALTDKYLISYAPSATIFAWLREKRRAAGLQVQPVEQRLLALGDPIFERPAPTARPLAPLPDRGVVIMQVLPGSNAALGQLKAGDVLLRFAGQELSRPEDLSEALRQAPENPAANKIALQVWRDGTTIDLTVAPGPLGVETSKRPAPAEIQARREADALLQKTHLKGYPSLPGTRREVTALARLFPNSDTLLGSEASEQRLEDLAAADRLRAYSHIHLATHGIVDHQRPLQSALILAQDRLPDALEQARQGKSANVGRLTVEQILASWKLDADLVTLSSCESAVGKPTGGEGHLGFAQALFIAGARNLVLSLWPVDDAPTALLMARFYENLLGKRPGLQGPMPKAEALQEAKAWLRGLTAREAEGSLTRLQRGPVRDRPARPIPAEAHPFAHPYFWSGFVLIGEGR